MAETELVITDERLNEILQAIFTECKVAINQKQDLVHTIDELRESVERGAGQIFIKSPTFSKESFKIRWVDSKVGFSRYVVDQFAGDGHITVNTIPRNFNGKKLFKISIAYGSFFILEGGMHIGPSKELKSFYKHLVALASKKTKRVEIFEGRFFRFQVDLLDDEMRVVDFINQSFRRNAS